MRVLTVLRFLLTLIVALLVPVVGRGEGIPCWVRCHNPPLIVATDAASVVKDRVKTDSNRPLRFIDRASGVLTTYLGKLLGIQGWRDYRLRASVRGHVVQAAGSTDLLYTIDIRIDELAVGGTQVSIEPGSRFIRAEVFPLARLHAPLPVRKDEAVCISGPLLWDADGFLEVHPKHPSDFACPTRPQPEN